MSLVCSVFSCILGAVIGIFLGLIAGYFEGIAGAVIMRYVDIQMSIPSMIFIIVISLITGNSLFGVILALSFGLIPNFTRVMYSLVLQLKGNDYIAVSYTHLDVYKRQKDALPYYWIFISIGVGVILAFVIVGRMKAQLKTVRFQAAAGNYVKDGSMNITESRDLFLYHTVTKTAKEKSSSGSSTHTSSSGRTHGGGGTKF